MPIVRTYRCNNCDTIFDVTCESSDGDPECQACEKVLDWQPGMFSVKTNRSRAMDLTQNIVEADYGLSDLNDNLREGDIAAKVPVPARAERDWQDKMVADAKELAASTGNMHPQAKEFFSGAGGPRQVNVAAAALADAKASRDENARAMNLFAAGGKRGEHQVNYRLLTEHGRTITVRR